MYFNILKRDLKRKKTMNIILLLFIILASTFIASSVNNVIAVTTALDSYFAKAHVPDYWIAVNDEEEANQIESFIKGENLEMMSQELFQLDKDHVSVEGGTFDYSNTIVVSGLNQTVHIFDAANQKIDNISDGEIYMTYELCNSYGFETGDKITLTNGDVSKTFTLKGSTKDALFGSSMIGMTRLLVSENDYRELAGPGSDVIQSISIFTDDVEAFTDKLNSMEFNIIFGESIDTIKKMYIMDMVIAAVMLIVSVCLILISLVILRFTIHFTVTEEFREIGVMKAIGIPNHGIRGLYLLKYFAIAVIGGTVGLAFSIPFAEMMIENVSRNIIIADNHNVFLNILCVLAVIFIVVLFGYLCTGKIRKFTPVDAIRNGENGERYRRKGFIKLSQTRFTPVVFMAFNDIFSGFRRFAVMAVIFTLGILLIIIPVNTINTLKSDKLLSSFSMAPSDHVIVKENILNNGSQNREAVENELAAIHQILADDDIPSDVFMELFFRMNISCGDKKCSSLAFQGMGDVTADRYSYLLGTPPQNAQEVGISHVISDKIGADIGDTVTIKIGSENRKYLVTAIFQTMNNMGEGIRFYQEEVLDYSYAVGSFGIQIKYTDNPDKGELQGRKELLEKLYLDYKVYTAGEYINYMTGDVAGQLRSIKQLILIVVICINMLVTVLMVKSFLVREKGEIAMLKAIGFHDSGLIVWQTLRIGIVLFISVLAGTLISAPVSKLTAGKVFQMMGAQSIEFDIIPLEVFVIYPAAVLAGTVFAAFVTAQEIRRISASETSNIE